MSQVDATASSEAAEPVKAPRKRRGVLVMAMVAILAGGGFAAWYAGWLGAAATESAQPARLPPPIYFDIDSNLIVNFHGGGRMRYLQVGVQAMTRSPVVVDGLKTHLPAIRNNLILLLSEQSYEDLSSRDGKAALREAALAEVQAILADRQIAGSVESIYFTSFVMQ